jgi:hypothetical protein
MSNDPQPPSSVIHLSSFGNALAAGAASTCTTFVSYPLDLVRTRFQGPHSIFFKFCWWVTRLHLSRSFPIALSLCLTHMTKTTTHDHRRTFFGSLLLCGQNSNLPFRISCLVHDGHRTNLPKYRGVGHALRKIAQTEGLRGASLAVGLAPRFPTNVQFAKTGLYAGIGPSLVGAAVSWTVYMWGFVHRVVSATGSFC